MYEDRRRRHTVLPEYWIQDQLHKWNWDSHLWGDKQFGNGITQRYCIWCGWVPPTECNISIARLCKSNPEVFKILENFSKDLIEFSEKLKKAWK